MDEPRQAMRERELAVAARSQAEAARRMGRRAEALARYREAEALCRKCGDVRLLAHTLRHIGDVMVEQGGIANAEAPYTEALRLYRSLESVPGLELANAVRSVAIWHSLRGQLAPAIDLWEEAEAGYRAVGVQEGVAECRAALEKLRLEPPAGQT